MIRKS